MIKPLRFTEDNCKKILEEIKHKVAFTKRWDEEDALLIRFNDKRELSLIYVDKEIVYSHYVAFFTYSQKRWPTQVEMYVMENLYKEIVTRAYRILGHFSLDDEIPFPHLLLPEEKYEIMQARNKIGLEDFRLERLSNAVYGYSHELMQERINDDIRELKSQVPQKLIPLDSATQLLEKREEEIMELRLEVEKKLTEIAKLQEEKVEAIAHTKAETTDNLFSTLLEDTDKYLRRENEKNLTRITRDLLHHIIRDKKYHDAINNLSDASEEQFKELLAAIEKPKINIERVNDIHDNDNVEAGL